MGEVDSFNSRRMHIELCLSGLYLDGNEGGVEAESKLFKPKKLFVKSAHN